MNYNILLLFQERRGTAVRLARTYELQRLCASLQNFDYKVRLARTHESQLNGRKTQN